MSAPMDIGGLAPVPYVGIWVVYQALCIEDDDWR